MIASVFGELRLRTAAVCGLAALACVAAQNATAADCPGHPGAIGTSRTIVVDPRQYPIIGTMQYGKTLPLEDREVVLTFDDGPLPKYSNQILDILAAHCAKATFFLVGRQAQYNPEGVRKVRDAGHTVATHTQNHPTGMDRLPLDRSRQEIERGIASVTAALADGTAPAPFVRMPGLRTNDGIEQFARAKGLQVWSADFPADDWRDVSAARVFELAMKRLHAKGKGILLLHDIQPRTVAALPRILHELKVRGYRIVHVVPAGPGRPATPTEPQQWQLHPASEMVAVSLWPKIPGFVFVSTAALPAPALSGFGWRSTDLDARTQRRARGVPLNRATLWPRQATLAQQQMPAALPIPAASIFKLPESTRVTMLAKVLAEGPTRSPGAQTPRATEVSAKLAGKPRRQRSPGSVQPAASVTQPPEEANGTAPRPAAPAKKSGRSAHVAG
jgi:peptidoglycan/xylan/chitin deacetylase (PgdA/CDA1 family)